MTSTALRTNLRSGMRVHKPAAAEEKYIRDALGFLSMTAPFWSHILYSEMTIGYTEDCPLAATDGHRIFVNVPAMQKEGWTLENVAFVLAHEVMHYVFGDLMLGVVWRRDGKVPVSGGKLLDYHSGLMNQAMDYRINACLIEGKVGTFPKVGLFNKAISEKGMEGCVEIYEKLMKMHAAMAPGGFDEHLEPGPVEIDEAKHIGAIRRVQAIAGALQAAQAAGKGDMPQALRVMVGEIMEPKVKWQEKLKSTMRRNAGEARLNWSKLNKRLISRPVGQRIAFAAQSTYGCGTVAIAIDTSGSVFDKSGEFLSEAAGIVADLNPSRLVLYWCDAKLGRVDDVEEPEDLETIRQEINAGELDGGGGTDFRPVFNHLKANDIQPDMLVFLTDGYGTFPKQEPDFKVIWGSITGTGHYPFGEVVEIEIDDDD